MLQSVKVRQLELETGRLLQENFELRASLISLQEQNEKEKRRAKFERLELLKRALEDKLLEITDIVQNMLPESSTESLSIQNGKSEKKSKKADNSTVSVNSLEELYLNEKLRKVLGEKKEEKISKKSHTKVSNDKQINSSQINESTEINDKNNDASKELSTEAEDCSFIYIEKKAFDIANKNIESKQKEKRTPKRKERSQVLEKKDSPDDFIYTRAKTNIEDKKQMYWGLNTLQCEKTKDVEMEKENIINFEPSCLKEKNKDNNFTEKNIRNHKTCIRKVLESKPSIVNKNVEITNDWKNSQEIETKTPAFLHVSEIVEPSSPEKRIGRVKKPVNYALPSLKTKMRRDDSVIEEDNLNKSYSKKNIHENQVVNLIEGSQEKSTKQQKNSNVSSLVTKCEKEPSVVIHKTTLSTKSNPHVLSMDTQKNSKLNTQSVLKSPIKFSNKKALDHDLSSIEELSNSISCMNKKETTNDNLKSESFEKDKRRRTVHDLLETKSPISYLPEYKTIQYQGGTSRRRKSMLA
ncbi:hypothetical protein T552_02737 [Pneumocystis carinii B80]|uniref:Shugoshin C-terminal domain-containing protein n=1 Tax=Pneumocystis carinii (strain B80) TaxID=1408658 RepID=A0A0W4ZEC3_PNEC8|nr:hypothetical protein T552_02737 [Pneumocystis carinii B80]KTW26732.1 hypothetical protein T552_02737 [Pneumocystis carinii B80]